MNTKAFRFFALAIASVLLFTVAFAQKGGVATYAAPTTFPDLDPSSSFSNENIALANVYETLTFFTADNTVEPKLATSWEVSDDGLTWTFHLREGVTFHDGSPLNAEAVIGSLQRTIDLDLGAAFIYLPILSMEAVGDMSVQFNLDYEAPMDLVLSSGYGAWIMAPSVTGEDAEWFNSGNGVGTGPYKFRSYSPGSALILDAYPDYWGGWNDDQFNLILFDMVEEPTLREQMVRSGETDFTYELPSESYASLSDSDFVTVDTSPSYQMLYGLLNTQQAPLDDVRVRQAVSHAFPYDIVVDNLYGGLGNAANGAVPSGMWGALDSGASSGDSSEDSSNYDLEKAAALLEEAGQSDGFEISMTYDAGNFEQQTIGELWKAELAKLNIDLDLQGLTWEAQWDLGLSGPDGAQDVFVMYWWPTFVSPVDFLFSMFVSEEEPFFNLGYYSNADYDDLVFGGDAISGTDKAGAAELFQAAQQILIDDAAAVYMIETPDVHAINSTINGYVNNPAYPHVVFWYNLSR